MKTFIPSAVQVSRKWHIIDVSDKSVGRVATIAADLLRGKGKPQFTPHMDIGDGVVIINAEKVRLSGAKWDQKMYHTHSGYAGGLRSTPAKKMIEKKPDEIIKMAVAGMIPKNKLKNDILKRLRVFVGSEHTLEAQQPVSVAV